MHGYLPEFTLSKQTNESNDNNIEQCSIFLQNCTLQYFTKIRDLLHLAF